MCPDSYAKSLEDVLKSARDLELDISEEVEDTGRDELLRAAALVAILSMIQSTEERSLQGRNLGSAWSQDHRRTRMGSTNVLEHRRKRSTWR